MANFDPNQWYHIYYNQNKKTALMGSQLYNHTTQGGTTFFQSFDKTDTSHQWQFYPIEDSKFYALRTKASGGEGFLGTMYSEQENTPGKTVPRMIRGNVSDESVYWNVGTFPDGTYFLSNKANKTTYHLTRKANSLAAMTSNTSANLDLPGQHFSFATISAINDEQFSTVSLPSATATSIPTGSPSSSPSGSPDNTDNSSGGLSTGAKAGIGVGVALAVVILLVVCGLFLWKRRQRNRAAQAQPVIESDNYAAESAGAPTYELPQSGAIKYEAYGTPHAELHHDARPAELPGETPPPRSGS